MRFPIDQIWIDEDAENSALTHEILCKLPDVAVFRGELLREEAKRLALEPDPMAVGKRILRLMKHKGAFVKRCPGTREYVCCGLEILHIGQGCPMDCRYCALQVYFNRPILETFVNTDDLFEDLDRYLKENPQFHRICTGEFTDSLALDPLTGLAPRLVEFFSTRNNASLEIKTKTDFVEPLLGLDPKGRVILAFSVNAEDITRREERKAAPLEHRIRAAARAGRAGYRLAFHFDPIIPLPGWEQDYSETVDRIFAEVDASAVAWISMGVLRFVPELKEVVTARFGPVPYLHEGFLRGLDGKFRLQADRRINVYRTLSQQIWAKSAQARIYLCMESPHVWEQALGIRMPHDEALAAYLEAAVT
jgi:spore photoproduct lyase